MSNGGELKLAPNCRSPGFFRIKDGSLFTHFIPQKNPLAIYRWSIFIFADEYVQFTANLYGIEISTYLCQELYSKNIISLQVILDFITAVENKKRSYTNFVIESLS